MPAVPLSPSLPTMRSPALRRLPAMLVVAIAWATVATMLAPAGQAFGSALLWIAELAAAGVVVPTDLPGLIADLCRSEAGVAAEWPARTAMWAMMATAMMLPCAAPGWRRVGAARDWRSGYGFLAGHLAIWLCFAVAAASLEVSAATTAGGDLVAVAVAAIAAWQWSAPKAAALARMRRAARLDPSSTPPGWRASGRDGVCFGGTCLLANGPLMGLMLLAGPMDAPVMAGIAAAMLVERFAPARLGRHLVGAGLLAAAAWLLAGSA